MPKGYTAQKDEGGPAPQAHGKDTHSYLRQIHVERGRTSRRSERS